MRQRKSPAK